MFGLGAQELLIFLLILLLLFGATRLPKLARSMGSAGKELREGLKGETETCPFCNAELASDDSFCTGCAKSRAEITRQRAELSKT